MGFLVLTPALASSLPVTWPLGRRCLSISLLLVRHSPTSPCPSAHVDPLSPWPACSPPLWAAMGSALLGPRGRRARPANEGAASVTPHTRAQQCSQTSPLVCTPRLPFWKPTPTCWHSPSLCPLSTVSLSSWPSKMVGAGPWGLLGGRGGWGWDGTWQGARAAPLLFPTFPIGLPLPQVSQPHSPQA